MTAQEALAISEANKNKNWPKEAMSQYVENQIKAVYIRIKEAAEKGATKILETSLCSEARDILRQNGYTVTSNAFFEHTITWKP